MLRIISLSISSLIEIVKFQVELSRSRFTQCPVMRALFVHGSGFDPIYGAGHVREVVLPTIELLEQALNEVERFMKRKNLLH